MKNTGKFLIFSVLAVMLVFVLATCSSPSSEAIPSNDDYDDNYTPDGGGSPQKPTDKPPGIIDINNINGVSTPVTGGTPIETIDNTQFSGTVTWEPNDSTFKGGTQYIATIKLTPKTGYTLKGVDGNSISFPGAESVSYNSGSGIITVVFHPTAQIIDPVQVNIAAPVKGITPSTKVTGMDNFSVGSVSWSPNDYSTFIGGRNYTVSITLIADSGFTFTGLTSATINGQSAVISDNTGSTVKLSYTFPETDTRTVTKIEIINQPTRFNYTHGDVLDLSGIAIRLGHDDSTTKFIYVNDLAAENITTVPAHGNSLVYLTHNNNPITINYGELTTKTTNTLIVVPKRITFTVDPISTRSYTEDPIRPYVTVKDDNITLTLNTDYTVDYANNTNVGTATVTIKGIGNYTGSTGSQSFTIIKASGAAVNTPTLSAKTHNSITINAVSTGTSQTVEYAINTSNTAPATGWQTGTTFSGLNAATTYYIFARSAGNSNYETGAASGSLSVTTSQIVSSDKFEYYWVDQHGSLVTTSGGSVTVAYGATLTITSQSEGYVVKQWHLNGTNTGENGNTYKFSSTTAGKHIIGLFVEKDGKLYNTNITITVTTTGGTVTFNINSGSGTTPSSQTASANNAITLPNGSGLTRSGYTFGGWNTLANGTGTNYNAGSTYYPNGNITLYARWLVNRTVTFNVNSGTGTAPSSQTVSEGSKITLPDGSGLTRSGYTFGGWNTLANGTGSNYNAGSTYYPDASITLYARWLTNRTVTFNLNGGTGTVPTAQTIGESLSITLPSGSGFSYGTYTFGGWNTQSNGKGTNYNAGSSYTVPTGGDTNLYAIWVSVVTFNRNGGSGTVPATQTVILGDSMTLPDGNGLTKTDYYLYGWYPQNGSTYYIAGDSYKPTGNITVLAIWGYKVTFDINGGTGIAPETINPDSVGYSVSLPNGDDVYRTGYVFRGWNTQPDGTGTNYSSGGTLKPTKNITLYAQWIAIGQGTREVTIDMYDSAGNGWDAKGKLLISIIAANDTTGVDYCSYSTKVTAFTNTFTFNVLSGDRVVIEFYVESAPDKGLYQNSFVVYYTDTPPDPPFYTGSTNTVGSVGPTSWSGTNALVYRLRSIQTSGTVSGTLQGLGVGITNLGSFTVP